MIELVQETSCWPGEAAVMDGAGEGLEENGCEVLEEMLIT